MSRVTKNLTGFERVEQEKKDAKARGKIRPAIAFREMKALKRKSTAAHNKRDKAHRKKQDEETEQERLE